MRTRNRSKRSNAVRIRWGEEEDKESTENLSINPGDTSEIRNSVSNSKKDEDSVKLQGESRNEFKRRRNVQPTATIDRRSLCKKHNDLLWIGENSGISYQCTGKIHQPLCDFGYFESFHRSHGLGWDMF